VKVGISEIPLFVIDAEDANFNGIWKELSFVWDKAVKDEKIKKKRKQEID
jgi:hypothetical protein